MVRKIPWIAVMATLSLSCGPRVARLGLNDSRLPVEARRWLADAEDEVSIARAERDEAQVRLDQAQDFRRYVDQDVSSRWPRNAAAASAREKLGNMARERIRLAELEFRGTDKRVSVARARLVETRADTAVRHDLASYNMEPLERAVTAARAQLSQTTEMVEAQRARVDEVTTAFWESYAAYLRSGGRNDVLWGWEN